MANDMDFNSWFCLLQINVRDRAGVEFNDEDSVRGDYEAGRDVQDVIDEIVAEYGERNSDE